MSRRQLVDEAYLIVGMEVRRLREQLGLNQNQLANRVGIRQNIISDIEIGKRLPDKYLYRLAVAFGVGITQFTSLVEPCPHCGGTGLRHRDRSRASALRRALLRERPRLRDTSLRHWEGARASELREALLRVRPSAH